MRPLQRRMEERFYARGNGVDRRSADRIGSSLRTSRRSWHCCSHGLAGAYSVDAGGHAGQGEAAMGIRCSAGEHPNQLQREAAWWEVLALGTLAREPQFISGDLFVPAECYPDGYFTLLLFGSIWPWAVLLLAMLAFGLQTSMALLRQDLLPNRRSFVAAIRFCCTQAVLSTLPAALYLTFFWITAASSLILRAFHCNEYRYSDQPFINKLYLNGHYSLSCSSEQYKQVRNWAIALMGGSLSSCCGSSCLQGS